MKKILSFLFVLLGVSGVCLAETTITTIEVKPSEALVSELIKAGDLKKLHSIAVTHPKIFTQAQLNLAKEETARTAGNVGRVHTVDGLRALHGIVELVPAFFCVGFTGIGLLNAVPWDLEKYQIMGLLVAGAGLFSHSAFTNIRDAYRRTYNKSHYEKACALQALVENNL